MTTELQDDSIEQDAQEPQGRYRQISTAAVVSLVFGLLSVVTPLDWLLGALPAAGVLSGWWALRRIRQFPEELTGRGVAQAGVILSAVFWTAGYGWLTLRRVQEVPYGYTRVTLEMLQPRPGELIPERAWEKRYEVRGEKVFVKGYMQPGRQQTRIKAFILCPPIPNCPVCNPNPKPTEMILVELEGDLEAQYTAHLVRVGGKLHVDPNSLNGLPYRLEADYLK